MKELTKLMSVNLLLFYSLGRLIFCLTRAVMKKEIKKLLWADLVAGIIYLFLCIGILGKSFFLRNQGLHAIVWILVILLFILMGKNSSKIFSYIACSLVLIDLLGFTCSGNMKFYGIIVIQIPILIIANFVKDDDNLKKYTYSTLIVNNLLNMTVFGSIVLSLLGYLGRI